MGLRGARRVRLDASFQYIDQDQPRAGAHRATVGQVHNDDHDEIRTVNRIVNLRADYDLSSRWGFELMLPIVSRSHTHMAHGVGDDGVDSIQSWNISGAGDLLAQGRFTLFAEREAAWPALTASLELKLPTGATQLKNAKGERAETPLQPGSGSWDFIAGLAAHGGAGSFPMLAGGYARLPLFASISFRENRPGTNHYRAGNELQTSVGAAYPVLRPLEVLGQVNLRVRAKDARGDTAEDISFTGGEYVYLSPGVRARIGGGLSTYAFFQVPVYRRVNQEQITANSHFLAGVTLEF